MAMDIELISSKGAHEYLVWDDNFSRVVATARLKKGDNDIEIQMINVERGMRGKGLGTALLKQMLEDFSSCTLYAWVFKGRAGWYERNGFEVWTCDGDLVKMVAS